MTTLVPSVRQAWLDLDDLCRLVACEPAWVIERVQAGLLPTLDGAHRPASGAWRFEPVCVSRVRAMRRIERGFDADPELAALVADLEGEIARLRGRLRALGG